MEIQLEQIKTNNKFHGNLLVLVDSGFVKTCGWTRYSSKQRRRTAGDSAERLPPLAKTQTTSARGSSSTSSLNNTAPNAGPSAASNGEYLESSRFPVLRSSSCENPSNNIGSLPRDQLTPPGLTNLNLQHLPAVGGRRLLLPPIHQQMGQIGQLQAIYLFWYWSHTSEWFGFSYFTFVCFNIIDMSYVNDTFKTFL